MVDGVLLAIGGQDDSYGSKQTSAIYALHPVDQKWQHVGDMPFECSFVDTLLLSGGRLLVVDGDSQRVLRVTVESKPYKCYGQPVLLTRLFSGLAMVFPSPLNTVKTDDRCVNGWCVPVGVLMVVMCTCGGVDGGHVYL